MTASMTGGTVSINGGPPLRATLTVEQDFIDVSTNLPKLDPRWSASDTAGHFHAVSADGSYPTLVKKTEHRECDGECCRDGECEDGSGYDVTVWACRLCGETVTPGSAPGPHYGSVPGRTSWTIRFDGPALAGEVSARYDAGGGTVYFGTAHAEVSSFTMSPGGSTTAEIELFGTSPLGRIGPVPVKVDPADQVLEQFIADAQVALGKLRKAAA